APLAAAVAYSRAHTGVHWASDVLAGATVGAGSALLTRRWWPVRGSDEARARSLGRVPELPRGEGLVIAVNPMAGDLASEPTEETRREFPAATVLTLDEGTDLVAHLERELADGAGEVRALGAAGGDGTVAAVASVASRHRLPLVVVPTGTLNHFARNVGVYDLREAVDATGAGEAVAVSLGMVDTYRSGSVATRLFLNTASLGCYPDLVRLRERWQPRWGKWPAFTFALVSALRRATPLEMRLDGVRCSVWTLFVGNGVYHPVGMVPAWRARLDSGLLDIRWLRADVRWSRMRAFCALAFGALGHSRVYRHREATSLDVRLARPEELATDGEVVCEADRFAFRVAPHPVPVYRRDEHNPRWAGRERPYQPW
ncbi:MAG: NAD(+)/NADH kinase, partial [Pseudonocardia sp.]|nr:NAD(+)/NADH kinase [Pseudonocardia sp.]